MSAKVKDYLIRAVIMAVLVILLVAATPVPASVGIAAFFFCLLFLTGETFL